MAIINAGIASRKARGSKDANKGKSIHLGNLFLIIATNLVPITRTHLHHNAACAGDKLWDIRLELPLVCNGAYILHVNERSPKPVNCARAKTGGSGLHTHDRPYLAKHLRAELIASTDLTGTQSEDQDVNSNTEDTYAY